ncbi:MAG: TolB family protein [Candidatus Rokuibacteriota bacterium]
MTKRASVLAVAGLIAWGGGAPAAAAQALTRVSVASDGRQANGASGSGALSADGRLVLFSSSASNLVPGGASASGLYVHDRATGATVPVTAAVAEGFLRADAVSADLRTIAFTNVVAAGPAPKGGPPPMVARIYVHDRATGATSRVDVASDGTPQDGSSSLQGGVAMSADGRIVAFDSTARNLSPGGTGLSQVYVHDRLTGITTAVSVAGDGSPGDGPGVGPALSPDGTVVAFASTAANLVPGGTPGWHIYVHERATGRLTRVSDAVPGSPVRASEPVLSEDGRVVAFAADTTDPAPGGNNVRHIYVHDAVTGITTRVSDPIGHSREHAVSADGRVVVFTSIVRDRLGDGTLVSNLSDVFVHDRLTGVTARVSQGGDWLAGLPRPSAHGNVIAFQSTGPLGGPDGHAHIAVHDRAAGTTSLVSVGPDGAPGNTASYHPRVAGDGSAVAFASDATNLVPGDTNGASDVFVAVLAPGGSPPPAALPALTLGLNGGTYRPGDTLVVTVTLTPGPAPTGPASTPMLVDAYILIRLPDGGFVSLSPDGRAVPGIVPIARQLAPVPVSGELLRVTLRGDEPAGTYAWIAALTETGTTNVIGQISEQAFTVTP